MDEQAFRFNEREGTDATRFLSALKMIEDRRLTYNDLNWETTKASRVNVASAKGKSQTKPKPDTTETVEFVPLGELKIAVKKILSISKENFDKAKPRPDNHKILLTSHKMWYN